jgi:exopolyphosphatase/guanosine-5'-triphosphate,3'-diphosphate pyrophosphatase
MTRRAAVDVGTNSVRLLVVDHDGTPLVRELEIVRLGRGVDRTGVLDDDRLALALEVIERFRDTWRTHGVADADARLGATSAVRDAADRDRFLDAVAALAPELDVRVLSGDDEAVGAFRGVAAALPDLPRPLAVVDVGGGSTELVVGDLDDRVLAATSLQLGSVRLTERFLTEDPPSEAQVLAALTEVRARVGEGLAALGPAVRDVASLVGVAGTVTTVAALALRAGPWVDGRLHGRVVPAAEVVRWSHELLVADRATIDAHPEVQDGRADVLAGGAMVVRGVVDALRVGALVVSESDGLDAMVLP